MSRKIVEKLARALDADDYETARSTFASNVRYKVRGDILLGAHAIVDSYRSSSQHAHRIFDNVRYDHEIANEYEGTFTIDYTDILTIADETHVHHARQFVTVDDGLVCEIVNVELDGEAESVDRFLARHGRSR